MIRISSVMPGFSDIDLVDLDIKPDIMDTNMLLNTFSSDEMDIWNNLMHDANSQHFVDENINSNGNKDSIKEENIDIEFDCFSAICPNDLLVALPNTHSTSEYLDMTHFNDQQPHQQQQQTQNTNEYNLVNDFNTILMQTQQSYVASSGRSSVISSRSTSVDTRSINDLLEVDSYTQQPLKYQIHTLPQQQQQQQVQTTNKSNQLPPSPPCSFGSDSDSNHSPSVVRLNTNENNSKISLKRTTVASTTLIKKIRHQPYITNKTSNASASLTATIKQQAKEDKLNQSDDDCWPFLCSLSKLPTSGPLLLTEEEKRTLRQENLNIPTQLPLSKSEEKILKKIRRKIKNKISAQESRRKKKEYVDALERRVDNYLSENIELKKRLEDLELNNKNLLTQLDKMQKALLLESHQHNIQAQLPSTQTLNTNNQFGTILMVIVLFFAVVVGVWSPMLNKSTNTTDQSPSTATASNAKATTATTTTTTPTSVVDSSTDEVRSFNSFIVQNVASKKINNFATNNSLMNNHEMHLSTPLASLSNGNDGGGGGSSVGASYESPHLGRSKSGNAVELTKVRPFARKIPMFNRKSMNSNSTTKLDSNDYIILNNSNEEAQVIVLNLAQQQQQQQQHDILNKPISMNTATNRLLNSNTKVVSSKFRVLNGGHSIIKLNSA